MAQRQKGTTNKPTASNGAAATNRISSVESRSQQASQVVTHTGPLPAVRSGSSEPQRPPSPLARRVAAENNVDIAQVRGTNPHGRVTREDVLQYMEQNVQKTPTQEGPRVTETTQPMQPVQRRPPRRWYCQHWCNQRQGVRSGYGCRVVVRP